MTVKQLIAALKKLPKDHQNCSVYFYDGEFGKVVVKRLIKSNRKWLASFTERAIILD